MSSFNICLKFKTTRQPQVSLSISLEMKKNLMNLELFEVTKLTDQIEVDK